MIIFNDPSYFHRRYRLSYSLPNASFIGDVLYEKFKNHGLFYQKSISYTFYVVGALTKLRLTSSSLTIEKDNTINVPYYSFSYSSIYKIEILDDTSMLIINDDIAIKLA